MIKIVKKEKEKRGWLVFDIDEKNNFKGEITELDCIPSSITNKFQLVVDLIDDINKKCPESGKWFYDLVNEYIDTSYNSEVLLKNAYKFVEHAETYVNSLNIDFMNFVEEKKITKTSIVFYPLDIKALFVSSTALKLYSVFRYDRDMKPPTNIDEEIYYKLIEPCVQCGVTTKIYQLVRTRTYTTHFDNKYMWGFIKMVSLENPDTYIMSIFNLIMLNLIAVLHINKNPISYVIGTIESRISWMMRNIYRNKIIYGDSFDVIDSIYGYVNKSSFYVLCCDDLIGKVSRLAMDIIENVYQPSSDQFLKIKDMLDNLDGLNPIMKFFIIPVASKVLNIPYSILKSAPPKHIALIGIALYYYFEDNFNQQFSILMQYLIGYSDKFSVMNSKSLYRIRNLEYIINDESSFYGLPSKTWKYKVMSMICGVLTANKKNLKSIITGDDIISKVTYMTLEYEIVKFFTPFYAGKLDSDLFEIGKRIIRSTN